PANLYGGTVTAGTGLGTHELNITGMTLPEDSITFTFTVSISPTYQSNGVVSNQAFLSGFPDIYGDVVPSDDPATLVVDDSTGVLVVTHCNDSDACTTDACDHTNGCIFSPLCDDGNDCTSDLCSAGICSHDNSNFPPKAWDARFGGSGLDFLEELIQTSDHGYL